MSYLQKFDPLAAQINMFAKSLGEIKVSNAVELEKALEAAKISSRLIKNVEKHRKEIVGPLNAQVKEINDHAKNVVAAILEADKELRREILDFETALEEQKRVEIAKVEALRREQEEAANANAAREVSQSSGDSIASLFGELETEISETDQMLSAAEREASLERERAEISARAEESVRDIEAQTIKGKRLRWSFALKNAEIIPRVYLSVNEKAVMDAIRSGVREIPGIEIKQVATLSVRS